MAAIYLTNGNDFWVIPGPYGLSVEIHGLNGYDHIGTSYGSDYLYGDAGNDWLDGGAGDDYLTGGADADTLNGNFGRDVALYDDSGVGVTVNLATGIGSGGTAQGDTFISIEDVTGSDLGDTLTGNSFENNLAGGDGDDWLDGGGADDYLHDYLVGGDGNDVLYGRGGGDTLSGGNQDDMLKGGGGADLLIGGPGIDTASYMGSWSRVEASLNLVGHFGEAEGDTLFSIENLTGSAYNDELWGNNVVNVLRGLNGSDEIYGSGGNDTLWGENGNDVLNGGTGVDTMIGGLGNDIYFVDNPGDVIIESGGQGVDSVAAYVNYTLPEGADIENLHPSDFSGTGSLWLTGNTSGNNIYGNDGYNLLDGGGGTDHLQGGGGDDDYIVDSTTDTITEIGGEGNDTVFVRASYTLNAGADVEGLETVNSSLMTPINLTGNASGNTVRGNAGSNVINGGDGDDELTGLGGQDSFLFDTPLNAAINVDAITDFNVAADTILLDQTIFSSSLGLGNISAGEFVIGAAALDANDRIIYNSSTGALFYDNDGVGGNAAIQFATLSTGLALTNLDFLVVA